MIRTTFLSWATGLAIGLVALSSHAQDPVAPLAEPTQAPALEAPQGDAQTAPATPQPQGPNYGAMTVEAIDLLETEPERAREMLTEAAEGGNTRAARVLGLIYLRGDGVEENPARAAELLEVAAEDGHAPSMVNLGRLYLRGEGVPQDTQRAAELYQRAADQGEARGMRALARLLMQGEGVEEDQARAQELLRQAYEQGDEPAALPLGMLLADEGRTEEAVPLLREALDSGQTAAAVPLARTTDDPTERVELYQTAAADGNAFAMSELGTLLLADPDRPAEDHARAIGLIRRANGDQETAQLPEGVAPDSPQVIGAAQQMLTELDYRPGPVDGIYGAWTREALRNFALREQVPLAEGDLTDGPTPPVLFALSAVLEREAGTAQ